MSNIQWRQFSRGDMKYHKFTKEEVEKALLAMSLAKGTSLPEWINTEEELDLDDIYIDFHLTLTKAEEYFKKLKK